MSWKKPPTSLIPQFAERCLWCTVRYLAIAGAVAGQLGHVHVGVGGRAGPAKTNKVSFSLKFVQFTKENCYSYLKELSHQIRLALKLSGLKCLQTSSSGLLLSN